MSVRKPDINGFRVRALRKTRTVVVEALKSFTSAVVRDTPVKTGALKSNWRFTVGSRNDTPAVTISDPTAAIHATIDREYDGDSVCYFTNPLPYANIIEYGGSPVKAPNGMLRVNLARFKGLLRQRIKQ